MFSLKRRYAYVRNRIDEFEEKGLAASERFVFVFGLIEKMVRRTLVYVWIHDGSGKTQRRAFKDLESVNQLKRFNERWQRHDSKSRSLEDVVGSKDYAVLEKAWGLRNKLFHGEDHAGERAYDRVLRKLIPVLDRLHATLKSEYGFAGWRGLK